MTSFTEKLISKNAELSLALTRISYGLRAHIKERPEIEGDDDRQWLDYADSVLRGSFIQIVSNLTDEEIFAIADRMATKYTHLGAPLSPVYGFVNHTLIDFARSVLAEQKGKP